MLMCLYFKVIGSSSLKMEFPHIVLLDVITDRRNTKSQHTGGFSPSKTLPKPYSLLLPYFYYPYNFLAKFLLSLHHVHTHD